MVCVTLFWDVFVEHDDTLQRIRSEPCSNCLWCWIDDVLEARVFLRWLSNSHQDNKRTPMPESAPSSSHSHSLLIGDSIYKKRKTKTRQERWELSHPFQEVFPYTGVSVGGLGHYSNFPNALFGSLFASQLSQSCLTVTEQWYMTTRSLETRLGNYFQGLQQVL